MSKIYQKMYLKGKNPAEGVLSGFVDNAILIASNSKSHLLSSKRAGFTLIELLVVVLIIGILAAIVLPDYRVAVAKSRYTQAIIFSKTVWDAQQIYYMANGRYAEHFSGLSITIPGNGEIFTAEDGKGEGLRFNKGYVRLNYGGNVYTVIWIGDKRLSYDLPLSQERLPPVCTAYTADGPDDIVNRVCLALGGEFTHSNKCSGAEAGDTCYHYRLGSV